MSTTGLTKEQTTNQVLESIDIIVNKRLEGLEYDKTELCTIVDVSRASEGIYTVSNGSARFKVYSSITDYKEEQKVYVTIPKGQYNEQKFITGAQVEEDEQNYNYVTPFDSFVPISDNLLECESNEKIDNPKVYILKKEDGWGDVKMKHLEANLIEDSMVVYEEEQQNGGDQYLCNYYFGLTANGGEERKKIAEYSFNKSTNGVDVLLSSTATGFTRLGLKADFKTLLNDIDVRKGTYGLEVYIYSVNDNQEEEVTPYVFYSSKMIGNPYKFPDWFQQEIVFDISKVSRISRIVVEFFQESDFVGPNNITIQASTEGLNNLLVKNVQLFLGYDIEDIEGTDLIKLFTMDNLYYQSGATINNETFEGIKRMSNRWLHKGEDEVVRLVHFTSNNETLKQKAIDNGCISKERNIHLFGVIDEGIEETLTDSKSTYQDLYFGATEPFYVSEGNSNYENMYNTLENEKSLTGKNDYAFEYINNGTTQKGFYIGKAEQQEEESLAINIPFDKEAVHNLYLTIKNMNFLATQYSKEELALYTYWLGLVIYRQYTDLAAAINGFDWTGYEQTELMVKIENFNTKFEIFKDNFEDWKSQYEGFAQTVKNNRYEMRLDKYYAGTGLEAGSRNNWYPVSLTPFDPDSNNDNYKFSQEDAVSEVATSYLKAKYEFAGAKTSDVDDDYVNFYTIPNVQQQTEAFSIRVIYGINLYPLTANNQTQMDILCNDIIDGVNQNSTGVDYSTSLEDSKNLCKDILQDYYTDYLQEGEATVVYSNDLTFMNAEDVPYSTTVEAAGALNIVCADGSYGNYFLYELDGSIVQASEASKERLLNLYLNTSNEVGSDGWTDVIQHADAVIWTFPPASRSMINVNATSIDSNGNRIIKILGDSMPPHAIEASVVYTIRENYKPTYDDNTISCTMIKDNISYTSTKSLSFGRKTSNGTSATMDIDFLNNFNAIDLNKVSHRDKQIIPVGEYVLKKFDEGNWGLKDGNKYIEISSLLKDNTDSSLTEYYVFNNITYLFPTEKDCSVLENWSEEFSTVLSYYTSKQIEILQEIKAKVTSGDISYYCYLPGNETNIFDTTTTKDGTSLYPLTKSNFNTYYPAKVLKGNKFSTYYIPVHLDIQDIQYTVEDSVSAVENRTPIKLSTSIQFSLDSTKSTIILKDSGKQYKIDGGISKESYTLKGQKVKIGEDKTYYLGDKVENYSNLYKVNNSTSSPTKEEYEHFDIRMTLYDANEKVILGDDMFATLALTAYPSSGVDEISSVSENSNSAIVSNVKLTNGVGIVSGYLESTIGVKEDNGNYTETEPVYTLYLGVPKEDNSLSSLAYVNLGSSPQDYLLYLTCSCTYGGYTVSADVALPVCDSRQLDGTDKYLTGYNGTRAFYYDSYGTVDYSKMPLSLTIGETKEVSTITIKDAWLEATLKDGSTRLFPKEESGTLAKTGAPVFLNSFDTFDKVDIVSKELLSTADLSDINGNVYKITNSQDIEYIVFENLDNSGYLTSLAEEKDGNSIWVGKNKADAARTYNIMTWKQVGEEQYDNTAVDDRRTDYILATFTDDNPYEVNKYYYYDTEEEEYILSEEEKNEKLDYWEKIYEIKVIKTNKEYEEVWEYSCEPVTPTSLKISSVETIYTDEDFNTTDENDKAYTSTTGVLSYKLVNKAYRFPNSFNHKKNEVVYYDKDNFVREDNYFYNYKATTRGNYSWKKYNKISISAADKIGWDNVYYFNEYDKKNPYKFNGLVQREEGDITRNIDYEKNAFYYQDANGNWKLETSAKPNADRIYYRPEYISAEGKIEGITEYYVLDSSPQLQNRNSIYWVYNENQGDYNWVNSGITYNVELQNGDVSTVVSYKYLYEFLINDRKEKDYNLVRTCYSTENYTVGNTYYGLNSHFAEKIETLNTVTINRKKYYVVNGKYCVNQSKEFITLYNQFNQFTIEKVQVSNVETISNKYKKFIVGSNEYYADKTSFMKYFNKLNDTQKESCYVTLQLNDKKINIEDKEVDLYEVVYMGDDKPNKAEDVYYCFAPSQTLTGTIQFYQTTNKESYGLTLKTIKKTSMAYCEPTKADNENVCIFDYYVFDNNILDDDDIYWDIIAENTGIDKEETKDDSGQITEESEHNRQGLVGYIIKPELLKVEYDSAKIINGWAQSIYTADLRQNNNPSDPESEYSIIAEKYAIQQEKLTDEYIYIQVDVGSKDAFDANAEKYYIRGEDGVYNKAKDWNSSYIYYKMADYLYLYDTGVEITLGTTLSGGEVNDQYKTKTWTTNRDDKGTTCAIASLRTYEEAGEKYITPRDMYISDAPKYGVRAYKLDNGNKKVLWIQPIISIQNRYPIGTINAWDGQKVQTNDSSILAPMIAAGAKNNDNSFTGLIMGDIRKGNGDNNIDDDFYDIGLYGFHEGRQSFGLLSKGTAFFGKSNKGRIMIDGDSSTLYNEGYEEYGGMVIDLDNATLTTHKENKYGNSDYQIRINGKAERYPLEIGKKFKVHWNGTLYATDGEFEGTVRGSNILGSYLGGNGSYIAGATTIIPIQSGVTEGFGVYAMVRVEDPKSGAAYYTPNDRDHFNTANFQDFYLIDNYDEGLMGSIKEYMYAWTFTKTEDGKSYSGMPLQFYDVSLEELDEWFEDENRKSEDSPLKTEKLLGSIGVITGYGGVPEEIEGGETIIEQTTYNLGLTTTGNKVAIGGGAEVQPLGIVFESATNARLSGVAGAYITSEGRNTGNLEEDRIYKSSIQVVPQKVVVSSNNVKLYTPSNNNNTGVYLAAGQTSKGEIVAQLGLHKSVTDSKYHFSLTGVDAENQTGIYARFA